jgi:GNAT superfamily N-acetyltransferase
LRFEVGCDLEEFKRHHRELAEDTEWRGTFGFTEELGASWERVLVENPSLLIVMRENSELVSHLIWHESSTDEHGKDDPRDEEDKQILNKLAEGEKDLVELHEVWLRHKYRRRDYGKQLFEFFEDFPRKRGYNSFVYYADHPAAIAICRKRGYMKDFMEKEKWHVFYHSLKQTEKENKNQSET